MNSPREKENEELSPLEASEAETIIDALVNHGPIMIPNNSYSLWEYLKKILGDKFFEKIQFIDVDFGIDFSLIGDLSKEDPKYFCIPPKQKTIHVHLWDGRCLEIPRDKK